MSEQSFAELGVSRAAVAALAARGITTPFAIQRLVIADALSGRDLLAESPTGSGKTLAFGIPLVDRTVADGRRPSALVLAPTRELAQQIVAELRDIAHARALRICAVYGGAGLEKQSREAARAHIVVATPGRLEDLLARGAFSLAQVRTLVLDEADRMLDMGFRPAVDRIVAACSHSERQTLFFSATLDGEAGRSAERYTDGPVRHEHAPAASAQQLDIEHRFLTVGSEGRLETLVRELRGDRGLTLVFVRTKHGADRLVKRLRHHGIEAAAMHGDKSQRQRERALAAFEAGTVDVLVATDVAARGIDVEGISHVINFDPPGDRDSYVHRVGRTGRAGRSGIGITLLEGEQHHEYRALAREFSDGAGAGIGGDAGAGRGGGAGGASRGGRGGRGGGSGASLGAGRGGGAGGGRGASEANVRAERPGLGSGAGVDAPAGRHPGRPPRRRRSRRRPQD